MAELDRLNGQDGGTVPVVLSANPNLEEARLESDEVSKYLLAKSYFDCREYDRSAAVFLPDHLPMGPIATSPSSTTTLQTPPSKKGKAKAILTPSTPVPSQTAASNELPRLSQKSLFLSLYAKFMAGEKRKDEESEMILGPADGGATVNRELVGLGQRLKGWCTERAAHDDSLSGSQGWLEYLYVNIQCTRALDSLKN